jgi:small basic protein (TIGR04137 family)
VVAVIFISLRSLRRREKLPLIPLNFLLVLPSNPALLTVPDFNQVISMSQHRSLRSSSTIAAKRNVLKRFERVDLLKKRGLWKDGRSVMNLPKTKPDA